MVRGFYRRTFLNLPRQHAGAYVIASVEREDPDDREAEPYVEATLTIADCNRVVDLDFDSGCSSRANALHKARLLRDVVTEFTAALEAEYAELVVREKAERRRSRRRR